MAGQEVVETLLACGHSLCIPLSLLLLSYWGRQTSLSLSSQHFLPDC